MIGWVVLAVGIAGLALPGIQGILTIAVGLAILSLASDRAHQLLRRALSRWPGVWRRVERLRRKLHRRLSSDE